MKHIHMYQNVKVYSTDIYYNDLSVKSNINFRKKWKGQKRVKEGEGLHISGAWPVEFPNRGLDSPSPQVFWASYLLPFETLFSLAPIICPSPLSNFTFLFSRRVFLSY